MSDVDTEVEGADESAALIDRWFPVAAVDRACGTPEGSGRNEKAIFTWFASRPIAQARAAVLCSLLGETAEEGDSELRQLVTTAVLTGNEAVLEELASRIPDVDGKRPVVLDCFSGRGIIPLEAARIGLRTVGIDLSPVAVLASRLLADWPLRDWSGEPPVPFVVGSDSEEESRELAMFAEDSEPRLVRDLRRFFAEVGRRTEALVASHYPKGTDGDYPWGYLWAVTIPCDSCQARFPLLGSLVLRHPYRLTSDPGQCLRLVTQGQAWSVLVEEGVPSESPPLASAEGKRGKAARCPFCQHVHPLETVKAKGFADQYEDAPIVAAELRTVLAPLAKGRTRRVDRKVFRSLTQEERVAATQVDLEALPGFGSMPAAPTEQIAPGNASTIDATGYGFKTFASLMNARQLFLFISTVRAIRHCYADVIAAGVSQEYAAALAAYATSNLVRRLRRATRGVTLQAHGASGGAAQNRNQTTDLFKNESGVMFAFDWFETGPGAGPGTWQSLTETTLRPLATHTSGLTKLGMPGRFRRASATELPYRDGTVDAIVTDPPYYAMINYADVSDLFYVWIRRCLFDIVPDLFGEPGDALGLQDKSQEIVVKQGRAPGDHRTAEWYEEQLAAGFQEMRRVLRPGGTLTVVFGHSDPAAWRRLLGALRDAGFVVTAAWPARTESANTGVASIKVTVTIGCRVAPEGRRASTAAQVEREIAELIRNQVRKWDAWGLALSDQLMASYGPAMQCVGRYRVIQRPEGTEPDLDHFLAIGRRSVVEAHAFKVDELPLDTFDPQTRFAIFWLRAFGTAAVNKGESVFHAQSSQLRIDELRPRILQETKGGFTLTMDAPESLDERSSVIEVVRGLGVAWSAGGTETAAQIIIDSGRPPDDTHLWATVGELVSQLPDSDRVAVALTACQRNRRAIETEARHGAPAMVHQAELSLDETGAQ